MKLKSITNLINYAFSYVIKQSDIYKIDESHGLKHSMEVFNLANQIYNSELISKPYLENQKDIIYASAILHDMCDKKYVNVSEGIENIKNFIDPYIEPNKLDVVENIISTMSYSKVKVNGYPNLGEYQMAYHIVREADLLTAYDIDRCIIFAMHVEKIDYLSAVKRAIKLFESRVLKYRADDLFVTKYSKLESLKRHIKSIEDMENLKLIIGNDIICDDIICDDQNYPIT